MNCDPHTRSSHAVPNFAQNEQRLGSQSEYFQEISDDDMIRLLQRLGTGGLAQQYPSVNDQVVSPAEPHRWTRVTLFPRHTPRWETARRYASLASTYLQLLTFVTSPVLRVWILNAYVVVISELTNAGMVERLCLRLNEFSAACDAHRNAKEAHSAAPSYKRSKAASGAAVHVQSCLDQVFTQVLQIHTTTAFVLDHFT